MGSKTSKIISDSDLSKDSSQKPDKELLDKERENQDVLLNNTDPRDHSEMMEFKRFKIEQKNEKSERKLRRKNAFYALCFSGAWAIFIALLILLHGFGKTFDFFTLTQTEFLFIIGSLTASIFTFYTLVLKYLFYRKPKEITTRDGQK